MSATKERARGPQRRHRGRPPPPVSGPVLSSKLPSRPAGEVARCARLSTEIKKNHPQKEYRQ